jgi:hypothetical protein
VKILFVTPNSSGSGEAVTALHMGRELVRAGHEVRYLASAFTAGFLRASFPTAVEELCGQAREDRRRWQSLIRGFKPRLVVFADYPLLFLSTTDRALLEGEDRLDLDDLDAQLVTLDHLGMAQGPLTLSFGPPHLELYLMHLPAVPERMKVLLPCPVQSPMPPAELRGTPFRYWQLPLAGLSAARRREIRERFLEREDGLLVFHSVPTWAQELSRRHRLPNYWYLTRLFEAYLGGLRRPVTVLSVHRDRLLAPSSAPGLRVVGLSQLAPQEYQELLFASDLMVTDNGISVSLGQAVCGLIPCAVLRNSYRLLELLERTAGALREMLLEMERDRPGAVFPFEVFPIWSREDLAALRLFVGNPLTRCVARLEIYGGEETRRALEALLTDPAHRQEVQSRQSEYVSSLCRLPDPEEALLSLAG